VEVHSLADLINIVFNVQCPGLSVGLLNLKGVELKKNLDKDKLNYLINAVGISFNSFNF